MEVVSTCYVCTSYLGARLNADPRYEADRLFFLKQHFASLARLPHALDLIVVSLSGEAKDRDAHVGEIREAAAQIGVQCEVFGRDNIGMSYGAFSDAVVRYGSSFTHYIFMEDDYVFTQPHFDTLLLEEMEYREKCGYLCGASYRVSIDIHKHAAVSLGMLRQDAMVQAAALRGGQMPFGREPNAYRAGFYGQKDQSFALAEAGWDVGDWLMRWSTAYWDSAPGIVRWFGREGDPVCDPQTRKGDFTIPTLVVPIQAVDKRVKISNGHEWTTGVLQFDGTVVVP